MVKTKITLEQNSRTQHRLSRVAEASIRYVETKLRVLFASYSDLWSENKSLFCADNVHFASSAQLVRALQDAEIQYRFQVCERNQHFTFLSYDVVQLKLYICTKYKIVWNMRNEWRHIWVYVYTRIFCRCTRIWTTISWAVVAIFIVYSLTFCSTIAGRTVTSKLSSHVRNVSSTRTCSFMEFPTELMN